MTAHDFSNEGQVLNTSVSPQGRILGGAVQRALAASGIALLPLGNLWAVEAMGRTFPIPLAWVPVGLLLVHYTLTSLTGRPDPSSDRRAWAPIKSVLLALVVVLALPLLLASAFWSGLGQYLNFALGVLGGLAIGWAWATTERGKFGIVDLALLSCLIAASIQVLVASFGPSAGHQLVLGWGAANQVATVLIVGSGIAVARVEGCRVNRFVHVVPLGAIAVAGATLTRGAVVAVGVWVMVLLWNAKVRPRVRTIFRTVSIAVPILVVTLVVAIGSARYETDASALRNINFRFTLWQIAWEQFLTNPLLGTGWASLRSLSLVAGGQNTAAHNLVASFLQIGGLAGLAFVAVFAILVLRLYRVNPILAAPIVAAAAMAMTEPMLELFIPNVLIFACITLGLVQRRDGQLPDGG